jgi:hypothetical protein
MLNLLIVLLCLSSLTLTTPTALDWFKINQQAITIMSKQIDAIPEQASYAESKQICVNIRERLS